jgi:hypothetical protein
MTLREAVIELVRHRLEIVIKRSLSSIVDGHHTKCVITFGVIRSAVIHHGWSSRPCRVIRSAVIFPFLPLS